MKRAYFVTGIDTDAGKSIVTGVLARALSARGERVITQKFIQTGCDGLSEDIETHRRIMGIGLLPEDEDGTTCPIVFTVCYLGDPDAGPVVTGYAGSFLLAGAYLAISCMTSAFTRNQIVSFITSTVLCLLLVLIGFPPVTDLLLKWGAPAGVLDFSADLSVFYHFTGMQRGVFDLRDIVYFLSLMVLALAVTGIALKNRRG